MMTSEMVRVAPSAGTLVPVENPQFSLAPLIAERALRLLAQTAQIEPGQVAIYAIPRPDRVVLVINVTVLQGMAIPKSLVQRLPATLNGRRVLYNERLGPFIQVGYWPDAPIELGSKALDLAEQPSPLHVPIGATRRGDLWLSMVEMDSALVAGTRQMGKTTLLHGWIQALIHGHEALLVLWDGKHGAEFARYEGRTEVQVAPPQGLGETLAQVYQEITRRMQLCAQSGVASLAEYNRRSQAPLKRIVLFIDEAKLVPEDARQVLIDLLAVGGAYGLHVVVATQYPNHEAVASLLKANLSTRIALPVPSHTESMVILGQSGAQRIPKTPGRMLLEWKARLVEAQGFRVERPEPGKAQTISAGFSLLSNLELRLAQTAMQCDGWYRVREIAERSGVDKREVNEIARRWEALGLLTSVLRNEHGHNLGRKITPALVQACGSGVSGDLEDQEDQA